MASVKTAVSIPEAIFDQAERLSHRMRISRSQLFARAVAEYVRRREARVLLDQLNEAYADGLTADESALLRYGRRRYRELLEGPRRRPRRPRSKER
jgi:hypothetical protein